LRYRLLAGEEFDALVKPTAPSWIWSSFEQDGDGDYAYEIPDLARFRVNVFEQNRGRAAVFRLVPQRKLSFDQLQLPPACMQLTQSSEGLILVTGPTGSGKSTTLAAVLDELNSQRAMHIVTIEDPIEFTHRNHQSLVTQREIGPHSRSFSAALRAAVREDPDAILVGELRDLETIEMALSAAETGLLVFGTLHTNSAAKSVDRVINAFAAERQESVRLVLSSVLRAVLSQQLLPRIGGGRVAAVELLFSSPALTAMIREGKTFQIATYLDHGRSRGMVGMDASLRQLVRSNLVEPLVALDKALYKEEMRKWLEARGAQVPPEITTL